MYSCKEVMAEKVSDMYAERLRGIEFIYAKNSQYKTVDLHDKKYPAVVVLSFDSNKVRLDHKFIIYYNGKPCNVSIEKLL